ncbi:MAG: enoyl-CoA hydratase-related protein [Actinomycetota bacterium]|nr:enoyl-CoA hydratase-related protein [Actinomycetota bacterium]MEC9394630.1 enoyl-CoA hydratase-related protein [Actinomycetota bacterium]MED6328655.1 enoyl-CoA hydratase-related protein [Actinomycetota bacterium]MEE2957575.1 enoyl-CoA hydratase-related protein [Actinomycetota bacterium]
MTETPVERHPPILRVDNPRPGVRRLTLNRPEKRNALDNELRTALFDALRDADVDDAVHVTVLRGAGPCFSSGYDLDSDLSADRPSYTPAGEGSWPRQATEGWLSLWDLAKPVIAQVHGYAMAGGSELAAACDLVYLADDATISHPVLRVAGTPDFAVHPWLVGLRNAMEMVLTGDAVTADEAVRAGYANRTFPAEELDEAVLAVAERMAGIPHELLQLNKRWVYRAMDAMGARTAIRSAVDLGSLAQKAPGVQRNLADLRDRIRGAAAGD